MSHLPDTSSRPASSTSQLPRRAPVRRLSGSNPAPQNGGDSIDRSRWSLSGRSLVMLGAVAVGAVVFGAAVGLLTKATPQVAPALSDFTASATSAASSATASNDSTPGAGLAQELGAASAQRPAAPPTVQVGDTTYALGEPGDVVVQGDWDGDGTPTAVVFRPASGEVYAFVTWPTAGSAVSSRLIAVNEGLVSLDVNAGPDRDQLVGTLVDGSTLDIVVP